MSARLRRMSAMNAQELAGTRDREKKFVRLGAKASLVAIAVSTAVALAIPQGARARWLGPRFDRFGGYGGWYGGGYGGYGGWYGGRGMYPAYRGDLGAVGPRYGYPYPGYASPGYGYAARPYVPGGYPSPAYSAPPPEAVPPYRGPYAYPPQGHGSEQTGGTMTECQSWASAQTGYHPLAPAAGQVGGGRQGGLVGSLLRGGARGGALGSVGGAIGGDAGKGAAMGAAVGGLFSLMRRREQIAAQQQQERQEQEAQRTASAAYARALESCLTAHGYSVR